MSGIQLKMTRHANSRTAGTNTRQRGGSELTEMTELADKNTKPPTTYR